ncbi:MAG: hypothetical protein AAF909_01775 [Pseudomonadota bacterium]
MKAQNCTTDGSLSRKKTTLSNAARAKARTPSATVANRRVTA